MRSFQLQDPAVSAQSYVDLTGRLGVYVGSLLPRLFVAWRPQYPWLAGGALATTGPNWYLNAHRAEAELEVKPWLLVFAGGGRRDFRPMIRDRYELDAGLDGQVSLVPRLSIVWAASGRKHWKDDVLKERVQDYLREDERTLQRSCGCQGQPGDPVSSVSPRRYLCLTAETLLSKIPTQMTEPA